MSAEVKQPARATDAQREPATPESLGLPAEHAPSRAASAVTDHTSNRPSFPPPAGLAGDSAPSPLGVTEDHRQAVASILQSLTGNTLQGAVDADAATERRCRELIGQRVNNFEIIGLLSSGGMGDVFEAIHLVIHRKVAIKVLRQEHVGDAALVQRFFNEARAANSIRHPNIVEILDVGMLPGGLPYIAMELLEGETLAQRLSREGKLEIERAVDFTIQSASALQAAHKRGIVHRDLKPDNLFIVADPRVAGRELVKVLDFGIAKLHGDKLSQVKTNVGSILGTPPYMSPEQCRGIPDAVDHRSDVYALGVILFEMLCGAPPFVAEGVGEVMVMHLSSPPPLPRWRRQEIPLRIEQTILWAMEKNPDQRIPSMDDFVFTLCSGPTPVPYIVTPTGLTTAELPPGNFAQSSLAPRYRAPAISLEGEFPTDETALAETPSSGRAARVERRHSTPPRGNRVEGRHSTPPDAEPALAARASVPPREPRSSWRVAASRGVALGALGVAAAATVVGFGRLGEREPRVGARGSELPPAAVPGVEVAASELSIGVATAALRTPHVPAPVDVAPHGAELARGAEQSEGAEPPQAAEPPQGAAEPLDAPSLDAPPLDDAVVRHATAPVADAVQPPPVAVTRATGGARWTPPTNARSSARPAAPAGATEPPAVSPATHQPSPAAAPDVNPPAAGGSPPSSASGAAPAPATDQAPVVAPAIGGAVTPHPPPASPVEATMGALNFDSSPWARVSVDGRVLGVTPLRGVHLPVGTHQLRLENSELGTSTTVVVDIKPGQSVSRFVSWEQRP